MNDIYEMWDKIFKTKKVTKDEKQLIQEHMDRVVNELKFFEYIMVDDDMRFNIIDSEEEREC